MKLAELGAPIARGGVSELFAWRDGRVLKLFNPGFPRSVAEQEARLTARLHGLGLRVPAVGEPLEIEGRFGFPMQYLDGAVLAERVVADPESAAAAARDAAALHASLHARRDPELPAARDLFAKILAATDRLAAPLRAKILAVLAELPEDDCVCHGDLHAGNIFVSEGRLYAIDCATVHRGNPRVDVAQSWVAMTEWLSFPAPDSTHDALRVFIARYEAEYFALQPGGRDEFERAKPVVAAVRLALPHPPSSDAPLRALIERAL